MQKAFLTCPDCCITVPVLNGFPILEEQRLSQEWDVSEQMELLFGSDSAYLSFLHKKRVRPVYDLYAAFQPFNESTQSIFPLIPLMREIVRPGDFILDLWCRTGWSGELLASLFPEQQVISVWESSAGLLGTKGFHYWLGTNKRRSNLDIIFHSPNQPLPFPDRTFAIVHGLDTLHRYKHVPFIPECLRVVDSKGILVFPHNHLTNSEPVPYFDRGEDQIHGLEYQAYFSRLLKNSNRRAFVLSEKALFDAGEEFVLQDQANTEHYNACILLADSQNEGRVFHRVSKTVESYRNAFVIVNPLWNIQWTAGKAVPASEVMDSGGATLFYRHPIYLERLNKYAPVALNETDQMILYWALRHRTVSEIAANINMDAADVFSRLLKFESTELVQIQNVSGAMARLQSFYSTQRIPSNPRDETLNRLWDDAVRLYGDHIFVVWPEDGSTFTYNDADVIIRMAGSLLKCRGVQAGDRILISAASHPEFVFAFWATVLLGAIAVPVSPQIKAHALSDVLKQTEPRLVLASQEFEGSNEKTVLYFGIKEDSDHYRGSFSEQIAEQDPCTEFPIVQPEQPAVILFTSGSTGTPKGIVLSHGALFRTSRIVDHAYRWRGDDRFLGAGSFHTMSGLRNPCIAILHSGASVLIPGAEDQQNPIAILSLCAKYDVTILNVTPAFLAYWGPAAHKAKYFQNHKLRMVLSTGSALQTIHREIFEKQFACPVYDYYGLTETSGACILETEELHTLPNKGIGKPWGCLVKICDDGELAMYGENFMLGYLNDPAATARRIRNGWLMTGDIAEITKEGCIVLVGRKDRMIKDKNGEMVYPEQLESFILRMENVADVHVTAYRDHLSIDHIAALIQFEQSLDQPDDYVERVRETLAENIPSGQMPTLFIPVIHLPKGPAGKISREEVDIILKRELRFGNS